ncbi:hypothetical protein [Pedobacter sp. NJ-S-72]
MKNTIILSLLSVSISTASYATTLNTPSVGKLTPISFVTEKKKTVLILKYALL